MIDFAKTELVDIQGNYLSIQIPLECVSALTGSGDCTESAEYWQKELKLDLDLESVIKELSEYGAWHDLETATREDLEMRIIWTFANDHRDREYQ